jgi:hypothetical protein
MFTRRLAAAIGLLFALIGTQGPEFSQQYRQRLGGALDELKRVVAAFNADAAKQSITPVEAIARLEGNPDPLAQARGAAIETDIVRRDKLQSALDAMQNAGPVQRIGAMAVVIGWGGTHVCAWPIRRRWQERRARRRAAASNRWA